MLKVWCFVFRGVWGAFERECCDGDSVYNDRVLWYNQGVQRGVANAFLYLQV